MGITIYDVSKLSGFSTATVSRAFSDPQSVREITRRKVYDAAEALHYSPNAIASSMARQRTDRIAFLICKESATIMDEFYAGICNGIMHEANHSEYMLLISTAHDWKEAESANRNKQIEGVILGGDASTEMISGFRSRGIAVVLVNNRIPGMDLPCVVANEKDGVRQAVMHLYEKGHRKIAMIAGRFSPYISTERYNAFSEAMSELGLPVDAKHMRMCEPDNIESAAATAAVVLSQKDRPTAVFGENDFIAAGTIKAALRMGLRVPEDLAVVGCDDSTICSVTEPELTSIHINCFEMGRLAVRKLTGILDRNQPETGIDVVPNVLHIRASA